MTEPLHLDHAATSHPKAPGVVAAVTRWYEQFGVSPERGDGQRCAAVREVFDAARAGVAALCGVPAHRVAWTSGATEALHLFFTATLRPGFRVLATADAHSSVVRPLVAARTSQGIELDVVPVDQDGRLDPADVERRIRSNGCDLLVLNHASNVTGVVQELGPCIAAARAAGALTLVDACQSIGAVDVSGLGADALAASAHKSLLGPPGLGFLATSPELRLAPPKPGGSGSSHALDRHPEEWPTAFEAGTPNSPAVFGLEAALRWRNTQTEEPTRPSLAALRALAQRLSSDRAGLRVLASKSLSDAPATRLPILSFTLQDWDPAELGILLDAAGAHVRSGFHCAPWIHEHLGTPQGTVRLSPGPFVTAEQILAVADLIP